MGVRGELFSNKVMLPNRTYFFNVKENRMGDLYLNIVESKNRDTGGFDRQSVILFAEDLQEFLKGFDESLRVLEKAIREKRNTGSAKRENRSEKPDDERGMKPRAGGRTERVHGNSRNSERSGERNNRRGSERGGERNSGRSERGGERNNRRGSERGGERNNRRGSERGGERNNERGSERGTKSKRVVVRKKD